MRHWLAISLLVVGIVPTLSQAASVDVSRLRAEAEQFERENRWDKAFLAYDQLLLLDRGQIEIRERRLFCLRQIHQTNRHRDLTYRDKVLTLQLNQALDIYIDLMAIIQSHFPDRGKVSLTYLFQQGVEEFWLALGNEAFRQERLPGIKARDIEGYRGQFRALHAHRQIRNDRELRSVVREAAFAAQRATRVDPTVVVMEFACGACNSLDEYSAYLTPSQLGDEFDTFKGEFVGIGIEVYFKDQKLVVFSVAPGSEADKAGIRENDHIVRINDKAVGKLSAKAARDLLKGEPGTSVELEVAGPGVTATRALKLDRRVMMLPSVLDESLIDDANEVGYIRLIAFQKSTLQELESAILRLKGAGMKVLVLDLRGNPGGIFSVAVQVAERFLPEGLIVTTQSPLRTHSRSYESHSGMSALDMPMVVLIDGDTASSAEVLAGALKENQRARLVGQTTFGKASIQRVLQLNSAPAGLRITLARYLSPRGNDYSGTGVIPDVLVERNAMMMMDGQKERAVQEAKLVLSMRP
jgi:carboxyl-terminal processing protease